MPEGVHGPFVPSCWMPICVMALERRTLSCAWSHHCLVAESCRPDWQPATATLASGRSKEAIRGSCVRISMVGGGPNWSVNEPFFDTDLAPPGSMPHTGIPVPKQAKPSCRRYEKPVRVDLSAGGVGGPSRVWPAPCGGSVTTDDDVMCTIATCRLNLERLIHPLQFCCDCILLARLDPLRYVVAQGHIKEVL